MAFDDAALSETHTITRLSIQSNTQISAKATNVISKLSPTTQEKDSSKTDTDTNAKPPLIILRAQSRWASKLISIVEIAKRDLEAKGIKVFQYNALSSEIVEVERKPRPKGVGAAAPAADDGNASEDEAFQTMGAGEEGGVKKRAVPVMTTYLTTQSVKALRTEFG